MSDYDRPLPSNVYAERMVLGLILTDGRKYYECQTLVGEDFSLEKHRRIWRRIQELAEAGTPIDHVTLYKALDTHGEAEVVNGLAGLLDLQEGMPDLPNIAAYVAMVHEQANLRRVIFAAREASVRAFAGQEPSTAIVESLIDKARGIGGDGPGFCTPAEVIDNFPGGIDAMLSPKPGGRGLHYGYYRLDQTTGGMEPGDLIVIGGRPSWGKTSMLMGIAESVATRSNAKAVAIFSLEMQKPMLLTRMICSRGNVDLQKYRAGYLDEDERNRVQEAASVIYDAPIHIDDTASSCLADITAKTMRLKRKLDRDGRELGFIGIDYLQLMPTPDLGKSANRQQQIGALTRGLKRAAKELGVPIIVAAQLSRALELRNDHFPVMSDLRESGDIENDCDVALFPYRPGIYSPDREDLRGVVRMVIGKQRNGPSGEVPMLWLAPFTKFADVADDWRQE